MQNIDLVAIKCGCLERVLDDTKEQIMHEVKALEVIAGVIRTENVQTGCVINRRLEFLEKSCNDILAHTVQIAHDSRGCVNSLRDSLSEFKRP